MSSKNVIVLNYQRQIDDLLAVSNRTYRRTIAGHNIFIPVLLPQCTWVKVTAPKWRFGTYILYYFYYYYYYYYH